MILFLDSSALIKLYVLEDHRDFALRTAGLVRRAGGTLAISAITVVEAMSGFARAARNGRIDHQSLGYKVRALESDVRANLRVFPVSSGVLERAVAIPSSVPPSGVQQRGKYPLRAYDAVQLATALHIVDTEREKVKKANDEAVSRYEQDRETMSESEFYRLYEGQGPPTAPAEEVLVLTFDEALHAAAVSEGLAHENPSAACPGGIRFSRLGY